MRDKIKFVFIPILLIIIIDFAHSFTVKSFVPQGEVKRIRQVVVEFSEAMTEFGDLRDDKMPFNISCPIKGRTRWVNEKVWAYEFEKDIPGGSRCKFILKKGIKSLKGKRAKGKKNFLFYTAGVNIIKTIPGINSEHVAEDQGFVLLLDGKIKESTVLKYAYFKVEGLYEKIPVRIISGDKKRAILKEVYFWGEDKKKEKLIIGAKRVFPSNKRIFLVWDKGIEASTGKKNQKAQILSYKTRPPFNIKLTCKRKRNDAPCSPLSYISLNFSNSISYRLVKEIRVVNKQGKTINIKSDGHMGLTAQVRIPPPHMPTDVYKIYITSNLKDVDGRDADNIEKFPLEVIIDEYPPLIKFSSQFGIIEYFGKKETSFLPVTIRNIEKSMLSKILTVDVFEEKSLLERFFSLFSAQKAFYGIEDKRKIIRWMQLGHGNDYQYHKKKDDKKESIFKKRSNLIGDMNLLNKLNLPINLSDRSFEVVGIPLKRPGFYVVELRSGKLAASYFQSDKEYMYVHSMALVTNLSVHIKWGKDNSLIWVTYLNDAKVVPNARVTILDAKARVLWEGHTNEDGVALVNKTIVPENLNAKNHHTEYNSGIFVFAAIDGDMSFAHSSWDKGIESFRFKQKNYSEKQNHIATSVMDRSLFRAGETVHFKNIVRKHGVLGIDYVDQSFLDQWKTIKIRFAGNNEVVKKLTPSWGKNGTSEGRWKIPKHAKLGFYQIYLSGDIQKDSNSYDDILMGEFYVEEFKVALSEAYIKIKNGPLINPKEIELDFGVKYLAGGGADNLDVKLLASFSKIYTIRPPNKDLKGFSWDLAKYNVGKTAVKDTLTMSKNIKLDIHGTGSHSIVDIPDWNFPFRANIQLEYKDPNGEIKSKLVSSSIYKSNYRIGIKSKLGPHKDKKVAITGAVFDIKGQAVNSNPVKIELFKLVHLSHRRKIVGGFYSYIHKNKLVKLDKTCQGATNINGKYRCDLTIDDSGTMIVQITSWDKFNREINSHTTFWMPGEDSWWFEAQDSDRIDALPDKSEYRPFEKARFHIKVPFKKFKTLMAIEREGILDYKVFDVDGKKPIIELPIKRKYAPNVYVSILAVRGRVSDRRPMSMIDLGRPAYKLGLKEIKVNWKPHRLKVDITTDKRTYKVGEKVIAKVKIINDDDNEKERIIAKDSELILAVVDKGLLEMMPNNSWNLLEKMMSPRNNDVKTATAQLQVVGKRHFGRKALPFGGDGGPSTVRELFDTLLLWKTGIKFNQQNEAIVDFDTNDSITQFQITGIVLSGAGKFGTGKNFFQTTKDLLIFSQVPKVARNNDQLDITFTLRNTTKKKMHLKLILTMNDIRNKTNARNITLGPSQSAAETWKVTIPQDINKVVYLLKAYEKSTLLDSIRVKQKILPDVRTTVLQSHFQQLNKKMVVPIMRPQSARPNQGGINVSITPSIKGNGEGISLYMKNYPYTCLEQKISKAVALDDGLAWKEISENLIAYLDDNGLIKYFASSTLGSDVLTSYFLMIIHEKKWSLPPHLISKTLDGLLSFVEGRVKSDDDNKEFLMAQRKLAALDAISRYKSLDSQLLDSIKFTPNLWPLYNLVNYYNVLNRLRGNANKEKLKKEIENIFKSRLYYQSSIITLNDINQLNPWYLMTSDSGNLARLILSLLEFGRWKKDIAKLVLSFLAKQKNGHWDLTTTNALGSIVLSKFANQFEGEAISGKTSFKLKETSGVIEWKKQKRGGNKLLPWPRHKGKVAIEHMGEGKPWVLLQSLAAVENKSSINAGFDIKKTIKPIREKIKGIWSVGDLILITLKINVQSEINWVVVNDPIPIGATILNKLPGEVDISSKGLSSNLWPVFEEKAFDAIRSYYSFVSKGTFTLSYMIRLNNRGKYKMPATRVEAMYHPDSFGELPNKDFIIK